MAPAVLGLLLSAAGLFLFSTRRTRFRRRLASSALRYDRPAAVDAAAGHVLELTGIDVAGWRAFAVPPPTRGSSSRLTSST